MKDKIVIKNARIHNLKGIDVAIPKHKLTVITGVSGSGKSSLAFDVLYEEGKRRYLMFSGTQFMIDNTSSFDSITGLSPTVAVEQRIIRQSNPRSTVGTRVKLSTMLAALYANYGILHKDYDDGIPLDVAMFQKNSPRGMCVKCLGSGSVFMVDETMLFSDKTRTLIHLFDDEKTHYDRRINDFCKAHGLTTNTTLESLTEEQLMMFKYGDGTKSRYEGLIPWLINAYKWSIGKHNWISKLECIRTCTCPKCNGTGLGVQGTNTYFGGKRITELEDMYISDLYEFLKNQSMESNPLLDDIITKLGCMIDVGLYHLSLSRPIPTLSGGEIQRLFLASYIIAEMDSIVFVFDEPTIGLHEVEKENLIKIIRNLVTNGNTVVAVEHDENFMREADYMIDLGPGAGVFGGMKIYEGGYEEFLKCKDSKTSPYLSLDQGFYIKKEYRTIDENKMLILKNAKLHNLKNVTAEIPLGVMVGIAGVSGSGKSSLISDTLVPKLKEMLKSKCVTDDEEITQVDAVLLGVESIKKCYVIDQRPIGRSRTSCPATYTGIFDRIRVLFANTEKSKENNYKPGLFSVNSEGGCRKCKGDGVVHYHVGFGNFIDTECEVCAGTGYIAEAMDVTIEGKNIRDILQMSVDEAIDFFTNKDKTITNMLIILQRVGMGYIKLGQATPTISGGESQRIKLAKELSKGKNTKGSLYILDEPTTGLSFYDSERLINLMNELVDNGNSVIVTEHDPYVLSNCDYIIEMGAGGGNDGGNIIATGSPFELKNKSKSMIGRYLKC